MLMPHSEIYLLFKSLLAPADFFLSRMRMDTSNPHQVTAAPNADSKFFFHHDKVYSVIHSYRKPGKYLIIFLWLSLSLTVRKDSAQDPDAAMDLHNAKTPPHQNSLNS